MDTSITFNKKISNIHDSILHHHQIWGVNLDKV